MFLHYLCITIGITKRLDNYEHINFGQFQRPNTENSGTLDEICVYVCVNIHTYIPTYIHTYMYLFVKIKVNKLV